MLRPLALSIPHSSSAAGFKPPLYSNLKYLMEPELSFGIVPPYLVSAEAVNPSTFPLPILVGALPRIINAPQSPGAFVAAADVNTTGLSAVPFIINLDPAVINITPLVATASFFTKDTVVP